MDLTVFDVFPEVAYEYLNISRGGVYGNTILSSTDASGVVDIEGDIVSVGNQESRQANSLLYIHPTESFITNPKLLVGNGIRVLGNEYDIVGYGVGRNQETQEVEHFELTLNAADFADYTETS